MPRIKSKASPQKHPPGLGTAAVPHSQETTIHRRNRRHDPFPSLTVVTAGETIAQSVAEAAKDSHLPIIQMTQLLVIPPIPMMKRFG